MSPVRFALGHAGDAVVGKRGLDRGSGLHVEDVGCGAEPKDADFHGELLRVAPLLQLDQVLQPLPRAGLGAHLGVRARLVLPVRRDAGLIFPMRLHAIP